MRVRATHPGPCWIGGRCGWVCRPVWQRDAPAPFLGLAASGLWLVRLILTIAEATNDLIALSKQVPLRHVPVASNAEVELARVESSLFAIPPTEKHYQLWEHPESRQDVVER